MHGITHLTWEKNTARTLNITIPGSTKNWMELLRETKEVSWFRNFEMRKKRIREQWLRWQGAFRKAMFLKQLPKNKIPTYSTDF